MPVKFKPVDVNIFMTTYLAFDSQDRISHDSLAKMWKVAKGVELATNGLELYRRMKIKDQHDVDKRLAPLYEKLANQKSKHYDQKKEQLNKISEALKRRVTRNPDMINDYINRYKDSQNKIQIEKAYFEKEISKHLEIKVFNEDNAELFKHKSEACRLQLSILRDDDAETITKKANDNFSETKKHVESLYHQLSEIRHHAQKKITHLDYILRLAVDNKIYSAKDIGEGATTWRRYLSGDAFAKKYFGTRRVCGRRKYIEREIPSVHGKQWQSTLIDYCDAQAVLKEYKNALKKKNHDGLSVSERCRQALMKDVTHAINRYDAKHQTYSERAEKTADHLEKLKKRLMIYDVAISDINRQIERVKMMVPADYYRQK